MLRSYYFDDIDEQTELSNYIDDQQKILRCLDRNTQWCHRSQIKEHNFLQTAISNSPKCGMLFCLLTSRHYCPVLQTTGNKLFIKQQHLTFVF